MGGGREEIACKWVVAGKSEGKWALCLLLGANLHFSLAKGKKRIIVAGDMNYSSGSRCGDTTGAFGRKRQRELRKPIHHI